MQTIQWFPGHMAKAKREILEKMNMVDLVIELKDARIPYSSSNPMVKEIIGSKPRLVLLNKSEMADKTVTKAWMDYYKENNILSLDIDSISGYHISSVYKYCNLALEELFKKREEKHIKNKQIKVMILGIPNVGKSTLINTLAKRKATNVGDKPGVTKTQTWIKVNPDFLILDTPGILWPKFDDQEVGLKLAMCGSIKDEILNTEDIARESVKYLINNYKELLISRYKLKEEDLDKDIYDVIEQIGKNRGALLKGGIVDYTKTYNLILNDLRTNRIGAMSYERPKR